jgi:hypothetical protein
MLIEEILTEVGSSPYPVESHFDPGFKEGPALVGSFTSEKDNSNVNIYIFYKESEEAILINFMRDGETKATGMGDQIRIFGTVLVFCQQNIPKMLKKYNPPKVIIRVNNAEQTRVKLYRRRLAPALSQILGAEWVGPIEETRQDGTISGTYFIWKKAQSDKNSEESNNHLDEPVKTESWSYAQFVKDCLYG